MVRIIETQMSGNAHLVINLAMLKRFAENTDFLFVGDQSQIELLNKRFNIKNSQPIKVQEHVKKWQIPFMVIYHFFIVLNQLIYSKSIDKVVFTSLFPITHRLVKPFFFISKAEKYIVLHGELKQINAYTNSLLKIIGKFLKSALLYKVSNLKYIVLGENIEKVILKNKWLLPEEIICIQHPYNFSDAIPKQNNPEFLKLVSIGTSSISKGSHYFIDLAKKNKNPKLLFEIVGALTDPNLEVLLHDDIITHDKKLLDSETYNLLLSKADIAVFFLNEAEYEYTASAAFLDAVKYRLPIFAIKNSYFKYYFKNFGDVGILFENQEELSRFILNQNLSEVLEKNQKIWEENFLKIIAKNGF